MDWFPLLAPLVAGVLAATAQAQDAGAATEDFEKLEPGPVPESFMVVEGEWAVEAVSDQNKVLELRAEPVVDGVVLVGPSLRQAATVRAKVFAAKGRRSFPRFGVGLYGLSGLKARVVPAQKKLELLKGDEVIAETPFDAWTDQAWWFVELKVAGSGDDWSAEARVWRDGTTAPADPTLHTKLTGSPGQGRASVLGSPFANKPIHFDDVNVEGGQGGGDR